MFETKYSSRIYYRWKFLNKRLYETFKSNFYAQNQFHVKKFKIDIKYWSKLLNIVNLYRNIFLVIDFTIEKNEFIIFYEFFTNYFFNYNFLKRIDQRNEYQIIKFSIDYKKFIDYQVFNIFMNYENEHIYRIIIEKNEIKRIFNVEWQNNKLLRV